MGGGVEGAEGVGGVKGVVGEGPAPETNGVKNRTVLESSITC